MQNATTLAICEAKKPRGGPAKKWKCLPDNKLRHLPAFATTVAKGRLT